MPAKKQVRKYKRSEKEIDEKPESSSKIKYVLNDLMEKIIMHCRVVSSESIEFKNRLGFNHTNLTLNKEQAVIIRILKAFPGIQMI